MKDVWAAAHRQREDNPGMCRVKIDPNGDDSDENYKEADMNILKDHEGFDLCLCDIS